MVSHKFCGCCLIIEGRRGNGHTMKWESSPSVSKDRLNHKSYTDNVNFASAIVLSGSNFAKIKLFCQFLGISCISKTTFHTYQRLFICPTIDRFYKREQVSLAYSLVYVYLVWYLGKGFKQFEGHSTYTRWRWQMRLAWKMC